MEDNRPGVTRYMAYIIYLSVDLLVLIFRDPISTGTSLKLGLFEGATVWVYTTYNPQL